MPHAEHTAFSQIVPGADNTVAIELITTHIHRKLGDRSRPLTQSLARYGPKDLSPVDVRDQYFSSLTILPETPQLQVLSLVCYEVTQHRRIPTGNFDDAT